MDTIIVSVSLLVNIHQFNKKKKIPVCFFKIATYCLAATLHVDC